VTDLNTTLPGLVVVAPNGTRWRWLGAEAVMGRRDRDVRVERLEGTCRHCGGPFEVTVKLPGALIRSYLQRRDRAAGDVLVPVPAGRRLAALELRNCEKHRHSTYVLGSDLL